MYQLIKLIKNLENELQELVGQESIFLRISNNPNFDFQINNLVKFQNHKKIKNIENSEFLLVGNVKFENNSITLSSNKAILNKTNNIIEFFNPVQYKVNDSNSETSYEVKSQNAYYNFNTKSVRFSSKGERVRSTIYF